VLGISRDNGYVVRCGQLFRETFNTIVFCDRDTDFIPVIGQSDSPERRRVASKQNYQLKRIRGQRFTIRRSTIYIYNDRDDRLGRSLLRQSIRYDHYVLFNIPTSV